jgi:hypothetical protein
MTESMIESANVNKTILFIANALVNVYKIILYVVH